MTSLVRRFRNLIKDILAYPRITLDKMDYDEYWRERHRKRMDIKPRFLIFAEVIEPGASVLDIGCGDGTNLAFLVKQRSVQARGLDLSEEAVRLAREKGIEAAIADVTLPDFHIEGSYDYIILSEMLEHIPCPEEVLLKMHGHFRKGVLVTIPNIGFYRHRLRLLCGRFPVQWVYHPAEHLRYWTVKDFIWWVEQLGYQVKMIRASNGTSLGRLRLYKCWPNLWGHQVVFWLESSESTSVKKEEI